MSRETCINAVNSTIDKWIKNSGCDYNKKNSYDVTVTKRDIDNFREEVIRDIELNTDINVEEPSKLHADKISFYMKAALNEKALLHNLHSDETLADGKLLGLATAKDIVTGYHTNFRIKQEDRSMQVGADE